MNSIASLQLTSLLMLSFLLVSKSVFVRKNAKDLTFNEWQELRRAIHIMKERSRLNRFDPLGFTYQVNIHGWERYDGSKAADKVADQYNWHRCQHGQYFFLIWHRMYIFFFERILRSVSNSPNLTLPYWDYFDPEQRSIPEPLRIPADSNLNPLYVGERCTDINRGMPLNPELVSPLPALKSTFFTTIKRNNELNVCHALGGARVDAPVFESDNEGLLELIPHNNVHLFVGGPNGYMSDNCRSARDPIFLLHHSQVDRIWESWTQAGGENTIDSKYYNQTFQFFDEYTNRVTVRVKDFLDLNKLEYRYDRLIESRIDRDLDYRYEEKPELYISVDERRRSNLRVSADHLTITVDIKPEFHQRMGEMAANKVSRLRSTLQLSLEQMESDLIFHMYLNLPDDQDPYESKPHFLGALTNIESKCVGKASREAINLSISNCFDVSESLKLVLKNAVNYRGTLPTSLNLTFVPKSCDSVYKPNNNRNLIVLNRVLLIHFFY